MRSRGGPGPPWVPRGQGEQGKSVVYVSRKVVITGFCGANAHRALSAAGIKIYEVSSGTAVEAGRLPELK